MKPVSGRRQSALLRHFNSLNVLGDCGLSEAGFQPWRRQGAGSRFQPMDRIFDILIPVALGAVLITLFVGLFALYRGGDFGRTYSNKLMRLRVVLQFVAIIVLVAAFWWRSQG